MQQRKTKTFTYDLIFAARKTMSMKVEQDGRIVVRAPYRMPVSAADQFVESHKDWINSRIQAYEAVKSFRPSYTEEERKKYRMEARIMLESKCREFAKKMGVTYGRISVREQRTRWGSCSTLGNLNFNWKLVLMPGEVQDYLVVHELAHRKEMNHSVRFWKLVEEEIPDYKERRKWLKLHGAEY